MEVCSATCRPASQTKQVCFRSLFFPDEVQRRSFLLRAQFIPGEWEGGREGRPSRWLRPLSIAPPLPPGDWQRAAGLLRVPPSPRGASRCQPSAHVSGEIQLRSRQSLIDDWFWKPALTRCTRYTEISLRSPTANWTPPIYLSLSITLSVLHWTTIKAANADFEPQFKKKNKQDFRKGLSAINLASRSTTLQTFPLLVLLTSPRNEKGSSFTFLACAETHS